MLKAKLIKTWFEEAEVEFEWPAQSLDLNLTELL